MRKKFKGYVYFIECQGFFKIGCSKDPKLRLNDMQVLNPFKCELIHTIKTNDMYLTERLFKDKFIKLNMRGEWFKLSYSDFAYIKLGKYDDDINKSIGNAFNPARIPNIL